MSPENPFSLNAKTILITGASSGIGRSTAIECAKLGANVIITGRNSARLDETFSQLFGDGHFMHIADLDDSQSVIEMISLLPQLDGVVFCAGIQKSSPVKNINNAEFLEVIQTNLFSTTSLCTQLLQTKRINKNSSLVFVSSIAAGIVAWFGNAMYSASKGALTAYAKVLALELSGRKIRVNSILPAMVKTNLIESFSVDKMQLEHDEQNYPLGYGEPIDVALAVVYLLSDASKWVTGTNLVLDGGLTLK